MRKSALFLLGLVVTALVALGLVVLLSASQPASRNAMLSSRNKAVARLETQLSQAQQRLDHAAPEDYDSCRAEVSGLEKSLLTLKAQPLSPYFFWKKQLVYCVLGIVLACLVARFDYHRWRDWNLAPFLLAVEIALLCAVFLFPEHKGSHRWISLGFADLQPSEFAKLIVVIVLAVWMDRAGWRVELFRQGALIPALILGAITVPILAEPDFGSSMVVVSAGGLVMFVAGTRWRYIVPMGLLGILAIGILVLMNPNRRARLLGQYDFLKDTVAAQEQRVDGATSVGTNAVVVAEEDKKDDYQVRQSVLAIRRGGVLGVGLYESMQKERYLPENHTDFIFAVGAEELGLPLTGTVIVLFLSFFVLTVVIARKSEDRLGRFIALGTGFVIVFQAFFNLGVISGSLPTKGMALPFFSYGGTSMLSTFIGVGMIFAVGIYGGQDKKRQLVNKVVMRGRN